MLLEHTKEKKPAVLIADKNPFASEVDAVAEWVKGASVKQMVVNNIYHSMESILPERFNGG